MRPPTGFTSSIQQKNATHAAVIDVGANNTLAIVIENGDTAVFHVRPEYHRFRQYSRRIAELQSELPDGRYTSRRIQLLYDERRRERDHSRDAAVKHAAEWLLERNVDAVYVGDLLGVLETHWSAVVNEKTHDFWSHGDLLDRLYLSLGDVGIEVEEVGEAGSSSTCPECGSEEISRDEDSFRCRDCGLDAHADVVGGGTCCSLKWGRWLGPLP